VDPTPLTCDGKGGPTRPELGGAIIVTGNGGGPLGILPSQVGPTLLCLLAKNGGAPHPTSQPRIAVLVICWPIDSWYQPSPVNLMRQHLMCQQSYLVEDEVPHSGWTKNGAALSRLGWGGVCCSSIAGINRPTIACVKNSNIEEDGVAVSVWTSSQANIIIYLFGSREVVSAIEHLYNIHGVLLMSIIFMNIVL
jgi:hypothetical protein